MASNGTPQPSAQPPANVPNAQMNIITALSQVLKSQTGESMQSDRIAALLLSNMGQLGEMAKQGKLNQQQIQQLKDFAEKSKSVTPFNVTAPQAPTAGPSKPQTPQPQSSTSTAALNAMKSSSPAPTLTSSTGGGYPITEDLKVPNPGPVPWPSVLQGRPTMSGGLAGGRMSGTPAHIARGSEDTSMLGTNDTTHRRKNSANDQSMRRSIQELAFSIDPNVKIDPEVEELLLDIADEFLDSVANFGCRLAKHRNGDTLEVRDLQLHLERNHNIRIPGFASDETRISISQSAIGPATGVTGAGSSGKKSAQNSHVTLRSQRLAQVAQAKKEAKLM